VNVFSCMVALPDEQNMYTVTILLNLPNFWLQYFAKPSESTNPFQGIYRGIEATVLVL